MAQLVQMRQRIKAIETIKKITHAMRLISMSTHSRLRNKAPILQEYQKEVEMVFQKVKMAAPNWTNLTMFPVEIPENNPLIILVASQKGLCGNFNSALFRKFKETFPQKKLKNTSVIAVGKYAIDYIKKQSSARVIKTFENLSSTNLNMISGRIVELIIKTETPYSSVIIVANKLKNFFVQKPEETRVIPLQLEMSEEVKQTIPQEPYSWEQDPGEVLNDLALQYLTSKIYHLIFQSILAEQAARFISMDNSTRNAKQLLENTKLLYNKLRQEKITQELTELSTSF